jgi:hypothetical protein
MAKKKSIKVIIKKPYKPQKVAYESRDKEIAKRIKIKQKALIELLEIKNDNKDDKKD